MHLLKSGINKLLPKSFHLPSNWTVPLSHCHFCSDTSNERLCFTSVTPPCLPPPSLLLFSIEKLIFRSNSFSTAGFLYPHTRLVNKHLDAFFYGASRACKEILINKVISLLQIPLQTFFSGDVYNKLDNTRAADML